MNIRMGKAIWHSGDYDYPVDVIRYIGTTDGVKYYLIRSELGETGVPEGELTQPSTNLTLQDISGFIMDIFK